MLVIVGGILVVQQFFPTIRRVSTLTLPGNHTITNGYNFRIGCGITE